MRRSKLDFMRQLGFTTQEARDGLYSGLMFQPRVVGSVLVLGVILQSPWIFIVLSAMLGWSALVPTHNPFNAFFNRVIADGRRFETLPPAPEPRRFAEGMAATLAMAIAVALLAGASPAAWLLEGLFALAVMEVIFARFCTGAYVYHLLCSRVSTRPCPPSPRTRDDIDGWA